MGVFTDQAHNLILLAEDEARMLGRSVVEPEHLLLALARRGNVERLLRERRVGAGDIRAVIVAGGGAGEDLVVGRVPWSRATAGALERSVDVAAARGVLGPSSEHVLLGLQPDGQVEAVLRGVGIDDVEELVDAAYPTSRSPVGPDRLRGQLVRMSFDGSPPRPGPGPPVFERFTDEAERAVRAAVECAALLEHSYVQPLHLLLGCLHVPRSVAGAALLNQLPGSDMGAIGEAIDRARMYGPNPAHQATGIFTDAARQILAEDALKHAYRLDHAEIGTAHILLATLDARDHTVARIIGDGVMGSGPVSDRLGRELIRKLPGEERRRTEVDHGVIQIDIVIKTLAVEFSNIVPTGWTLRGSGRSGGIRLRVPDSESEQDFRIDLDWIVAQHGHATDRLRQVALASLEALQQSIVAHTGAPWPPATSGTGPPKPGAELVGDDDNRALRLWYGQPDAPALEIPAHHPLLLNMLLNTF